MGCILHNDKPHAVSQASCASRSVVVLPQLLDQMAQVSVSPTFHRRPLPSPPAVAFSSEVGR
eukprot:3454019-Amphidinium_carterae.1